MKEVRRRKLGTGATLSVQHIGLWKPATGVRKDADIKAQIAARPGGRDGGGGPD